MTPEACWLFPLCTSFYVSCLVDSRVPTQVGNGRIWPFPVQGTGLEVGCPHCGRVEENRQTLPDKVWFLKWRPCVGTLRWSLTTVLLVTLPRTPTPPPPTQLHNRFDANIINLYFRIAVYADLLTHNELRSQKCPFVHPPRFDKVDRPRASIHRWTPLFRLDLRRENTERNELSSRFKVELKF